jgi:hypothetical protein
MYGTGTESSLKLKDCCTGAGNVLVVVIDIAISCCYAS